MGLSAPAMLYLLDTNICIHLIQRQPPQVLQRLVGLRQGQAVMSVVTYAELCAGLEIQSRQREHDAQVLALLIQRIPVLPFTETAAEIAGTLLPEARHLGMTLADCASIATAIEKGLVVWTANPRWTQLRADGATIEPIRKS